MAWCDPRITPAGLELMDKKQPHVETLSYLMDRFKPLIEAEGDGIILVCADRCGTEGDVVYMGTSAVLKVEKGVIRLWGACGINEEKCLVVDTEDVSTLRFLLLVLADHGCGGTGMVIEDFAGRTQIKGSVLNAI
jgi:protein N-terminal amidase